jgi:glycine/serine hydroxymethyltransferase
MQKVGNWVADVLEHIGDASVEQRVRKEVAELASRFPIYAARMVSHLRSREQVNA